MSNDLESKGFAIPYLGHVQLQARRGQHRVQELLAAPPEQVRALQPLQVQVPQDAAPYGGRVDAEHRLVRRLLIVEMQAKVLLRVCTGEREAFASFGGAPPGPHPPGPEPGPTTRCLDLSWDV